jgi:hypothetical protein
MKALSSIVIIVLTSLISAAEAQQPLLSPRDSVKISFNGKTISVNYGRPSMRGRKIMGGLVPLDKVWRTGANEATAFITEADLVIEGVEVPKGSYTIYTLPSEKQWRLIINKQTGQWGTVYHQEMDLSRIPMKKRAFKEPVEIFTIALEKNGNSTGRLKLIWEKTEVWVNFKVKQESAKPSNKSKK